MYRFEPNFEKQDAWIDAGSIWDHRRFDLINSADRAQERGLCLGPTTFVRPLRSQPPGARKFERSLPSMMAVRRDQACDGTSGLP